MKVTLQNITKTFDQNVIVDGVSFTIEDDEMFFLLGPSGCGKTTILRMIAGFYPPDAGDIFFGNRRMNDVPPNQRNTALVFQNYAIWPHLTVFENVAYGLRVRRVSDAELRKRVDEALAQVRLTELANRKPTQLSGGQQQRVALARAIVVKPDLLLFDEPLSNLDAKLRIEMREQIQKLRTANRYTSLYVTHDQEEALSLASRIAVMNAGKIQQVGTPQEIYDQPANAFVASFIGEINMFQPTSPLAKALKIPTGKQFGFRPERVEISTSKEGMPAVVESATYLGSKLVLQLLTEGDETVKAWADSSANVGGRVRFTVAPEHIHQFDA